MTLTPEETQIVISALREYRHALIEEMSGDDRDTWLDAEVHRVQVLKRKLGGE